MSTLSPGEKAPADPIPRSSLVRAYFYANCVVDETTRYKQLDRYEAHAAGRQYSHLPYDWWGKNADAFETVSPSIQVPLGWEQPMLDVGVRGRRPTAPWNLCKAVVDRFTGLLFSESRRPTVVVEGDQETEGWLRAAVDASSFWAKVRQARTVGGASGAVLVTAHARAGKLQLEVHNPKHCTILWRNRRTHEPEAVLLMWKHLREEEEVDPKTRKVTGVKVVTYLYRRIISEQEDVVFKPVKLDGKRSVELKWDVESVVRHDLGFFPGVWVQNLPVLETHDGDPDCAGGWQILDTIDRMNSQMNQGLLFNLDPTLVLKYDSKEIAGVGGVRKGSDNALTVGVSGSAEYLEITGQGVDMGLKFVEVQRQRFLDLVRCVFLDPATVSGSAQSAKAIEYMYAPMLEKADDLRAQWGDLCVVPLLRIMEKIGRHFQELGASAGVEYRWDFPKKLVESEAEEDGSTSDATYEDHVLGDKGGYVRCQWGPYFAPTEQDDKQRIDNAVSAKAGGLIDSLTAIKHVAPVFKIQHPEEVKARTEEEGQAEMDKAMASLDAQVGNEGSGGNPFQKKGEPPKTPPAGKGGKA